MCNYMLNSVVPYIIIYVTSIINTMQLPLIIYLMLHCGYLHTVTALPSLLTYNHKHCLFFTC